MLEMCINLNEWQWWVSPGEMSAGEVRESSTVHCRAYNTGCVYWAQGKGHEARTMLAWPSNHLSCFCRALWFSKSLYIPLCISIHLVAIAHRKWPWHRSVSPVTGSWGLVKRKGRTRTQVSQHPSSGLFPLHQAATTIEIQTWTSWGFLASPVVKSPPINTGDMGSIPDPGRSHMPWNS